MTQTAHPATQRSRSAFLSVMLTVSAAFLFVGAPAAAQASESDWEFTFAPYVLTAAMQGTTTLEGQVVEVDVPSKDLFSNMELGLMGVFAARKGVWGFGVDAMYMPMTAPATYLEGDLDMDHGSIGLFAIRKLGAPADVNFGVRINTLNGDYTMGADQSETWIDPVIGLTVRTTGDGPVGLKLYSEIGGFSLGSQFTWQFFPALSVRLSKGVALELGYRWLDVDYADGEGNNEFRYDMLTQGPLFGISTRF